MSILVFSLTLRGTCDPSKAGTIGPTSGDKMDLEMSKQTDILVALGKQEARLDSFDSRVEDLTKRLDRQTFFVPSSQSQQLKG